MIKIDRKLYSEGRAGIFIYLERFMKCKNNILPSKISESKNVRGNQDFCISVTPQSPVSLRIYNRKTNFSCEEYTKSNKKICLNISGRISPNVLMTLKWISVGCSILSRDCLNNEFYIEKIFKQKLNQ